MAAKIETQQIIQPVTVDLEGLLSFAVENRGTTEALISFDGNSFIDLPPDTTRPFGNASGEKFTGEMQVEFGSVPPVGDGEPVPAARNKALIIKYRHTCI